MARYEAALIAVFFVALFMIIGDVSAQNNDCIECSDCANFEVWKSMCDFTYQMCIIQGLPEDFCIGQKRACIENIDGLIAECNRICKDSCAETETCPDDVCAAGENCPADAAACQDMMCYEPTCIDGCGQTAVPPGATDEACNADNGCNDPPCSCDGNGNCAGESGEGDCPEQTCTEIISGYASTLCSYDANSNSRIDLAESTAAIDDWMNNVITKPQVCAVTNSWKGYCSFTGECPEDDLVCDISISFDRQAYCPGDAIEINIDLTENSVLTDAASITALIRLPNGGNTQPEISRASTGRYQISGYLGGPGARTIEVSSTFGSCELTEEAVYNVFPEGSTQCGGEDTCPDNACAAGENCPADAAACPDVICYEPTCTNGCGQTAVTAGATDEACNADNGCNDPPCSCDGDGNCASTGEPQCSINASLDKAIYCEGDSVSIFADYISNSNLEDPTERAVILERSGSTRDLTDDFVRLAKGRYVTNNQFGTAGMRTFTFTSTMPDGCTAETTSQVNVRSSADCIECETPANCDDNNACTANDCVDGSCVYEEITTCSTGDGCCPSGCNPANDGDCEPECSTPLECDDNNVCTIDSCRNRMCVRESKTACENGDGCCPSGCTKNNDDDCTDAVDVLIVALKNNMDDVYSSTQLANIENKIRNEYVAALQRDGLNARFLYLDEDETADIAAIKVEKSQTRDYNAIDGVLEELIKRINPRYVIIIGGQDRFPMGVMSGYDSDDLYGNYGPQNGKIDIPVGRIIDPNNGDYEQLVGAIDEYAGLHDSGGLDLSSHAERTLADNYLTMECFSLYIFGEKCPANPNCRVGTSDSRTAASGKDFFYLTEHGSPGPPQSYSSALRPGSLESMDLGGAMWMIVPCHGGVIDYDSSSQSITQMFAKRRGAVFFGSTYFNSGAVVGTQCTERIDNGGVGALYYRYARNFAVGKRIGDSYVEGKNEYLEEIGYAERVFINNLYGDPTLKIKKLW